MINSKIAVAVLSALLVLSPAGLAGETDELTVFAAASLTGAFGEIGQIYENETNMSVAFNLDGSQSLRTQIENRAYADVLALANNKQMNALKKLGLMNNSSIDIFTRNKIALIIPRDNPAGIKNLSDLAKPGLKIVIGTRDVPVGDYALQIIDKLANDSAYGPDYREKVMDNVISQEMTVSYIVTKVALGEADVGFAYVSDVTRDLASRVDKIEIPDEYNVVAEYPIGLLEDCRYPVQARKFIDLVMSDEARAVLEKYGFVPVESEPAKSEGAASATKAVADSLTI
jgi:molybdate transport system substrate-binding protein